MLIVKSAAVFLFLALFAWPINYWLLMRRDDIRNMLSSSNCYRDYMRNIREIRRRRGEFSYRTRNMITMENVLSYSYVVSLLLFIISMIKK